MKISVGNKYIRRDGSITDTLDHSVFMEDIYPFCHKHQKSIEYTRNGRWDAMSIEEHPFDIVSIYHDTDLLYQLGLE